VSGRRVSRKQLQRKYHRQKAADAALAFHGRRAALRAIDARADVVDYETLFREAGRQVRLGGLEYTTLMRRCLERDACVCGWLVARDPFVAECAVPRLREAIAYCRHARGDANPSFRDVVRRYARIAPNDGKRIRQIFVVDGAPAPYSRKYAVKFPSILSWLAFCYHPALTTLWGACAFAPAPVVVPSRYGSGMGAVSCA